MTRTLRSAMVLVSAFFKPIGIRILESSRGWKISKEKAANKIDGIVALAMASLEAVK